MQDKDEKIYEIRVRDCKVSDSVNVRRTGLDDGIDELADSIKAIGLLQPIVLLGEPGKPPYEIVVGQRRWAAHKKLNRQSVKAMFLRDDLDKTQVFARSLAENMLRVDLNHADAADAVTKLYRHFVKKVGEANAESEVRKATGMSLQRIRIYIKVSERASPKIKLMLKKKKVSLADVRRVLHASNGDNSKAERLLALMEKHGMTKYQKIRLVEYGAEHSKASAETIVEEAKRPRVERTIVVSLDDSLQAALEKATKALELSPEEVATTAISEWLSRQGFSK